MEAVTLADYFMFQLSDSVYCLSFRDSLGRIIDLNVLYTVSSGFT